MSFAGKASAPFAVDDFTNPTANTCYGQTLQQNDSCTLIVGFSPSAPASINDSFTIDFGVSQAVISVSGTGIASIKAVQLLESD
jgi:hypothetical protein